MADRFVLSNKEIYCVKEGFEEIEINALEKRQLNLRFPQNIRASLLIYLQEGHEEIDLNVNIEEGAEATILYWNNNEQDLKIRETITVKEHAKLTVAYSELAEGNITRNATYYLKQHSYTQIRSAMISAEKKHMTLLCQHDASFSEALMENYAIVLKGGDYLMSATGKIIKHASGSKSHQTTRVLTFDDNQKTQVLPQLFIDENDVEASHATSLGQPDENQLYYMQSRGLSRNEAMQLITIGYLLPIADVIEDEALQSMLKQQIEMKVNKTCLM